MYYSSGNYEAFARMPRQAGDRPDVVKACLLHLRSGLRTTLLDLRNSGDTASDRSRVVGYAALAFAEPGAEA